MGRRKRGLFRVDTGRHSPELNRFLSRWLTPGHVPGKHVGWPDFGEGRLHPDEGASYRSLAKLLWTGALVPVVFAVTTWLTRGEIALTLVFLGAAAVLLWLGVWSWRTSKAKSELSLPFAGDVR